MRKNVCSTVQTDRRALYWILNTALNRPFHFLDIFLFWWLFFLLYFLAYKLLLDKYSAKCGFLVLLNALFIWLKPANYSGSQNELQLAIHCRIFTVDPNGKMQMCDKRIFDYESKIWRAMANEINKKRNG